MNPEQALKAALIGDPSPELLDDAARHAAARHATVRTRDLGAPALCPEQEPNQPPDAFVSTMGAILASPHRAALVVEALHALADADLVLPPRLIVPLLADSEKEQSVAEALPPVLGARGRWVARLDPTWPRGNAAPQPEDWDFGTFTQRLAWLRYVRAENPDEGRRLVEGAKKEKAAHRAAFVAALGIGLSAADEEFLGPLLRDRSKEVGSNAAKLLARIDGSAYQDRAVALAGACFTVTDDAAGSPVVSAVAPAEADLALDYYHAEFPAVKGPLGRVQTLVAMVPPARWADLGVPLDLLARATFLDGERVDLVRALTVALRRTGDTEAARVLAACLPSVAIACLLPAAERDERLAATIRATGPDGVDALCTDLIDSGAHGYSPIAAAALLELLDAEIARKGHMSSAIVGILAGVNPEAAPQVIAHLTALCQRDSTPPAVARRAREIIATLTFRRSIHQSLAQPKEPR